MGASERHLTDSALDQLIEVVNQPLCHPIRELSLLRKSLLFAELSHLAYFLPEQIASAVKQIGFEDYQFLSRESAQAYVFLTTSDCVVVFRGTERDDVNDLKADVDAVMVVAETIGKVHRGFKQEVDRLWEPLEKLLQDNTKPLWFTGHSLGGAMATISAGRCVLSPIPSSPEGLFTFGSPRVGNRRYINFVKLNHLRWVNNNDVVTRLPPRWLGYRHSGVEYYLNARGQVRCYSPWRKFRDRWLGFYLTLRKGKVDHLDDHLIASYIKYLLQAVQEEDRLVASGRIPRAASSPKSLNSNGLQKKLAVDDPAS
jgi:triacylglycerol lipase